MKKKCAGIMPHYQGRAAEIAMGPSYATASRPIMIITSAPGPEFDSKLMLIRVISINMPVTVTLKL